MRRLLLILAVGAILLAGVATSRAAHGFLVDWRPGLHAGVLNFTSRSPDKHWVVRYFSSSAGAVGGTNVWADVSASSDFTWRDIYWNSGDSGPSDAVSWLNDNVVAIDGHRLDARTGYWDSNRDDPPMRAQDWVEAIAAGALVIVPLLTALIVVTLVRRRPRRPSPSGLPGDAVSAA